MNNMENFEQLRRKMMWVFENKREIPPEVEQIIQRMFNRIEEEYREMGCLSGTIQEYMQGNLDELLARLQNGVGYRRKDAQFHDIQAFLSGVQTELEEQLDNEEQKRRDIANREKVGKIGNNQPDNIRTSLNTVDLVEESLRDIQSRQNSILEARSGHNWRQIEQIDEEVRMLITRLRSQNEEGIHREYLVDDANLRKELLQAFDEYLEQRGEAEPDKANEFKESLFGGISLEEQRKEAEKRTLAALFKGDETAKEAVDALKSLDEWFK